MSGAVLDVDRTTYKPPADLKRWLEVRDGTVREWSIEPEAFGLPRATAAELAGGTPAENARIIEDVLAGRRSDGARSAVLLNTAAALYVAGRTGDFADGVRSATNALGRGAGIEALDRLRRATAATPDER